MDKWFPIGGAIAALLVSFVVIYKFKNKEAVIPSTTDTVQEAPLPEATLAPSQIPQVKMRFEPDGHFVVVTFDNLHGFELEYNLIYEATVKGNRIQTGVSSTKNVEGQTTISQRQLLGSESSGKFTYHDKIKNANLELTLRDKAKRSIFTAIYPFEIKAVKTIDLKPSI